MTLTYSVVLVTKFINSGGVWSLFGLYIGETTTLVGAYSLLAIGQLGPIIVYALAAFGLLTLLRRRAARLAVGETLVG